MAHAPIWGYREFFKGSVIVPLKISVRGTIILVHGCASASTISLNLNRTVWLFILLSNKTLCMFLSGGYSSGNIKDCLFISGTCFVFWSDELFQLSPSLSSVVDSVSLCLLFSADLPMKKSFIDFHMFYTVTAKDTRIMIKERFLRLDDGVNNDQWKHQRH